MRFFSAVTCAHSGCLSPSHILLKARQEKVKDSVSVWSGWGGQRRGRWCRLVHDGKYIWIEQVPWVRTGVYWGGFIFWAEGDITVRPSRSWNPRGRLRDAAGRPRVITSRGVTFTRLCVRSRVSPGVVTLLALQGWRVTSVRLLFPSVLLTSCLSHPVLLLLLLLHNNKTLHWSFGTESSRSTYRHSSIQT